MTTNTTDTHGREQQYTPEPFQFERQLQWQVPVEDRPGTLFFEPWPGHAYAVAVQPKYVNASQWENYAARIVACVNALAGIDDPAAFVAKARQMEAALKDMRSVLHEADKLLSPNRQRSIASGSPMHEEFRLALARVDALLAKPAVEPAPAAQSPAAPEKPAKWKEGEKFKVAKPAPYEHPGQIHYVQDGVYHMECLDCGKQNRVENEDFDAAAFEAAIASGELIPASPVPAEDTAEPPGRLEAVSKLRSALDAIKLPSEQPAKVAEPVTDRLETPKGNVIVFLNYAGDTSDPRCYAVCGESVKYINSAGTVADPHVTRAEYYRRGPKYAANTWPIPAAAIASLIAWADALPSPTPPPEPLEGERVAGLSAIEQYDRWCKWMAGRFGEQYAAEWESIDALPGAAMPKLYQVMCEAIDGGKCEWLGTRAATQDKQQDKE